MKAFNRFVCNGKWYKIENTAKEVVLNTIKSKLIQVFGNQKLEDGIGFFEAIAIDDEKDINSPICKAARVLDEREDWQKVLKVVQEYDYNYDPAVHSYMDEKGKIFFLPVMILAAVNMDDEITLKIRFSPEDNEVSNDSFNWLKLLSTEQRKCIIEIFELLLQYSIEDCMQYKEWECVYCQTEHSTQGLSKEEAMENFTVEAYAEIVVFLKTFLY